MGSLVRKSPLRRAKLVPALFGSLTPALALVAGCVGVVGGDEDEISDSRLAIRQSTISVDPDPVVVNEAYTLQASGLSADKPYELTLAATGSAQVLHSEAFSVGRDEIFSRTFDSSFLTSAGDYEARVELIQRQRNRLAGSLSFSVVEPPCTDCSPSCGNGVLDSGETCDPPSACPADCDDGNSCTTDLSTGSALTCNTDCSHTAVAACVDGDGCCPGGCGEPTDSDCGGYVYFPAGDCETGLIELALNGVEPPQSPVDAGACLWMDAEQAQTELLVRCVDVTAVMPASVWVGPAIPNDQFSVDDCLQIVE